MDRKWLKRRTPSKKLTGYFVKENSVPVHRKKEFPAILKRNKTLNRIIQKDVRVVLGGARLKTDYEQNHSQNSGSDAVKVTRSDILEQLDVLTRDKSEIDYTAKGDVRFSSQGADLNSLSVENDSLRDEMAVRGPAWPNSQATQELVSQDESLGYDLDSSVVSSEQWKHGVVCYRGDTQELLNL